jgi:hypothetical protein
MIVLPRTPAVLFVGRYDGPIQPASLLNRTYRGRQLYGPSSATAGRATTSSP